MINGIFSFLTFLIFITLILAIIKPSIIFRRSISRKLAVPIVFFILCISSYLVNVTTTQEQRDSFNRKESDVAGINTTNSTSTPSPTVIPTKVPTPINKNITFVKVINVIDGDTIEIEGGKKIRFIGIDTPESVDPRVGVQCFGKEASARNKEILNGKSIRIEKDVSETDKYGRMLRYIYVDNKFINELLVREGYAISSSYPPDIKYQTKLREAERLARAEKKGLWGKCTPSPTKTKISPTRRPTVTPTKTIRVIPTNTPIPVQTNQVQPPASVYGCDCSKTCSVLSCSEAQFQLNSCGCSARDGDDDGVACDSKCQ